jgi:hypothetical protein
MLETQRAATSALLARVERSPLANIKLILG